MFDNRLMLTSVTAKGQATIPKPIRALLKIHEGKDYIGFYFHKGRIELVPVNVDTKPLKLNKAEWEKIETLAKVKGKRFKTAKTAIQYLDSL
jgi:AbrB family looped-hinge helix DNA binding protein